MFRKSLFIFLLFSQAYRVQCSEVWVPVRVDGYIVHSSNNNGSDNALYEHIGDLQTQINAQETNTFAELQEKLKVRFGTDVHFVHSEREAELDIELKDDDYLERFKEPNQISQNPLCVYLTIKNLHEKIMHRELNGRSIVRKQYTSTTTQNS